MKVLGGNPFNHLPQKLLVERYQFLVAKTKILQKNHFKHKALTLKDFFFQEIHTTYQPQERFVSFKYYKRF